MIKIKQIKAYNANLAETLTKIDNNDYFKYIHDNFYPNQDISFMDYFLELINSDDEFCVDHSKLQAYGVINGNKSSNVLRCLDQYNLIEGENYLLLNVEQQSELSRGIKYSKQYKLTPDAFKICLMRAKNSQTYANYYLLHEKNFKHYNDYRLLYDAKLLSMKDDKIDRLEAKVDQQSKEIRELIGHTKDIKHDNAHIKKQNYKLDKKVTSIKNTLKSVSEDVAIPPVDRSKINQISIIKNYISSRDDNKYTYAIIRTQKRSHRERIKSILNKLYEQEEGENIDDYKDRIRSNISKHVLITITYNGNGMYLYNRFKELLDAMFVRQRKCFKYTDNTKTQIKVINRRKFLTVLDENTNDNEILDQLKDQLIDEGCDLNIGNFLITLLEIVEDEKRDVNDKY